MDKLWNELLEFETRDLVERFMKKKFGREPNTRKIQQITSNFIQGREYFKGAEAFIAPNLPVVAGKCHPHGYRRRKQSLMLGEWKECIFQFQLN